MGNHMDDKEAEFHYRRGYDEASEKYKEVLKEVFEFLEPPSPKNTLQEIKYKVTTALTAYR